MSLKDIDLKPEYISPLDDVAQTFYTPVMRECVRFDRISCYFSLGALATYSEGLYFLGKNNHGKYRLIISENISEDTYNAIRDGYNKQKLYDDLHKEQLLEDLSLKDRMKLSNLAFLMSCGIVEIKFGFCRNGLFHSKSGYVCDADGNELCFVGSNNETRMSIEANYEKFHVTTSWLSSEFDRIRISQEREGFETFWEGKSDFATVFDPPESFNEYMQNMNRGRTFERISDYLDGCCVLDFEDDRATLSVSPMSMKISTAIYSMRVMSLVEEECTDSIRFKKGLPRRSLRHLYERALSTFESQGTKVEVTDAFYSAVMIDSRTEELALLGTSIKSRSPALEQEYQLFKAVVDENTVRKLRDEQMRDSFFLYKMGKAANFSVPGSGKTSTVLGMFAYLHAMKSVDKLIVLGPLSSFDSWKGEFLKEFDGLMDCRTFRSDEHDKVRYDFQFNSWGSNLILFNYESCDHDPKLVDLLRSKVDEHTVLVFDEVHRIKGISGKRAGNMLKIAVNATYAVVMTGTPIPNSYTDAYNFLHILFDSDDYDEYFGLSPGQLDKIGKDEIETFNNKMYPFFCRTTKNKLGVPTANRDSVIRVKADEAENDLLNRLKGCQLNPLTMIIRMLQLESDPSMLSTAIGQSDSDVFEENSSRIMQAALDIHSDHGPTTKATACADLVEDLVGEGKKVILWCIFRRSMSNLESMLEARGIKTCQVNGGTQDRKGVIDGFRGDAYQVLITNPQTLAESVSLHDVCHDAVYFEYNYNLVHLLQSKDRIHRLGLMPGQYTQYHYLEVSFENEDTTISLDHEIRDRLEDKERIMLDAIESNRFEQFPNMIDEVEDILTGIGMIPKRPA